jgi:hypothetical protein
MANAYSTDDLLEFLGHSADRGLMPATTAQALAVASRNVLGVLTEAERDDLSQLDIDAVIKRFVNKRAKDFNPASLKEYGRRVRRAVELFLKWREDPSSFTVKTRASSDSRSKKQSGTDDGEPATKAPQAETIPAPLPGTYQSSFPVRPGLVVTLNSIPYDLTSAEAERLASFIRMLAVG